MDLLRDVRRRVAGGTAAAVLVPVAIVAVAVALGTGSGLRGLAALGQAFSGPAIPGVEPATTPARGDDEEDAGSVLADVDPSATAAPAASRPGGRRTRARRRDRSPGPNRDGNRPAATPAPGSQPEPAPTAPPDPTPAPTEPPSTIRQVGDQVKQVTDRVPIAGEPAGQVVDTIVDTVDQLPLPKLP